MSQFSFPSVSFSPLLTHQKTIPGALVYTPACTVTMHYTYVNRQPGPVDVWLALPPELPTQRRVRIENMTPTPIEVQPDGWGVNRLAFFRLTPEEALRFDIHADLYYCTYDPVASGADVRLSEEERRYFLRSSPLVRVTDEVRSEARRIVGEVTTPLEQARRLFVHLVTHYRYKWPPAARGSEAMRRSRQGDCGEYSFLYAAWCRALDIPCRVMVGTFAHETLRAHVWNEVFIEGVGWLPVDASVRPPFARLPGLIDLDVRLRLGRQFGRLFDERLVFSIDPDVMLQPPYVDSHPPECAERSRIADRDFAWGFESLDGAAPYLQPIYIRFDPQTYRLPSRYARLVSAFAAVWPGGIQAKVVPYLGVWWFDDPPTYRLASWALVGGFVLGATGTLLGALDLADLGPLTALGYTLANLIFIQRTGIRWWKLLLLVLFLLDLIVQLARLVAR